MAFVEFESDQPDEVMDGAALDTTLAALATRTASYERDNFRERALDWRCLAVQHFVRDVERIEENNRAGTRAGVTLGASLAQLNINSTAFETSDTAYEAEDLLLVQYSLFMSSEPTGAADDEGIPDGAEVHAVIEWSDDSGSSWTTMSESYSGVGGPTGWTSELGQVEEVAHHSCLAGFAVFDGVAKATLRFRVAVKDALSGTPTVYFEDCRMWVLEFRQVQ